MNEILSAITTVLFTIVACIGLGWFCKYMIDQSQKNTDRMFEMFEKGNAENREAIRANTDAINKLVDKLDKIA